MAFGSYRVPGIGMYLLPQDTNVTCWAACAAALVSTRKRRMVSEIEALPDAFKRWYSDARTVTLGEIRRVYSSLRFREGRIDLASRPGFVRYVQAHAPIIVASSIVAYGTSVQHQGYHVRVITGYWGDPDSDNEDDLQIRIFDPAPPPGFRYETPFLFSHFSYQMALNTGPTPQIVGSCWHL